MERIELPKRTLPRRRPWHALASFLVLCTAGAHAQEVGEIVSAESPVTLTRQGGPSARGPSTPLLVGDTLSTGKGAARLLFSGESVATRAAKGLPQLVTYPNLNLNLGDDSLALIRQCDYTPTGPRARFVLERGTAYALFPPNTGGGAHYEITTPTAVAIAKGTAFVITYNTETEVTEVVTLSGSVDVMSVVKGEEISVTVTARQITSVAKGAKPSSPEIAPEQRLRQCIEGLEFAGGGRGESLIASDPVRTGQDVELAERCKLVLRPQPETLDPCPLPSTPTCILPEPLGGLGNLGINF